VSWKASHMVEAERAAVRAPAPAPAVSVGSKVA
jgi:hypothetical protein